MREEMKRKPAATERDSRAEKQKKFDDMKNLIRKLEGAFEVLALAFVYYQVWRACYRDLGFRYYGNGKYILVGVYALLVFVLFLYCECFRYGYMKLMDMVLSQWISLTLANIITYFQLCLILNHMADARPMILLWAADLLLSFLLSYLFTCLYHRIYVPKRMLMVYGSEKAVTLKGKMDTRSEKYQIEGMIPVEEGLEAVCRKSQEYDAVILNDVPAPFRNDVLKFCYAEGIRTYVVPKLSDIILGGAANITLFDTPLLLVKGRGFSLGQRAAKRGMDLALCLLAMIPAAPIMALVALAIKWEDHGPVFFRQDRVTKDGKIFSILKFRSMVVDAEKEGVPIPATDGDPRITKVGRIIRATRLDELPQLLNILKGDMSLVGPRPERVEHVERYTAEIPEFPYRLKVKGGLTGFAQIYGKYNTSAYDKLRLDLMYIEKYSLLLDIKLVLMTLRIMVKPESTEGFERAAEMEEQRENIVAAENIEKTEADVPGREHHAKKEESARTVVGGTAEKAV